MIVLKELGVQFIAKPLAMLPSKNQAWILDCKQEQVFEVLKQ